MDVKRVKEEICAAVDSMRDELLRVAKAIHAKPELAFQEHEAAALLVGLLREAGLEVSQGVYGLETAFAAEFGPEGAPCVALLAEYDALPQIGHACGHNLIAASGVGAVTSGQRPGTGSAPSRANSVGSVSPMEGLALTSMPSTFQLNSIGMPFGSNAYIEWMKPWSMTSLTLNPAAAILSLSSQRPSIESTPKETWSKTKGPLTGSPWPFSGTGVTPSHSKKAMRSLSEISKK